MLYQLKQMVPYSWKRYYHLGLGVFAKVLYRDPSQQLFVIGVTGTNGKSSTVQFISQILTELGEKTGYTTTAGFMIAGEERENRLKMTMPGRFLLQRLMKDMVEAECTYAIIETSSQGVDQFRHIGLNYDLGVFTNLTPEHIEAHGGFEAYKKAKGAFFAHLAQGKRKIFSGKKQPKISVINGEDEHAEYYASFPVDKVIRFGLAKGCTQDLCFEKPKLKADGLYGEIQGVEFFLPFLAGFEQKNALAAIAAVHAAGFSLKKIAKVTPKMQQIPGRFERVDLGQDFEVIVDYAYEPYALEALFASVKPWIKGKMIGIHGSAGGGRDIARREKIGALVGKEEDIVFVTNEDPYDEDPRSIIEAVAEGARQTGKTEGKDLFLIDDRGEAIYEAIRMAKKGDVVLITGKGSEPVMAVAEGKKIPWSDRLVAEDALRSLLNL